MLDVSLLGTGGMMPLPGRWLTSMMVRYEGRSILVDCGEGTQIAVREAGLSFRDIDYICFTHFHADHMAGLPGLLLTEGNSGRTEPVYIAGPKGIDFFCKCLLSIAPLPFDVKFIDIENSGKVFCLGCLEVEAQFVQHNIPCYAYRFNLKRIGRFDVSRAEAIGLPKQMWKTLQQGEPVEFDGREILPDEVLGPPRKGLKLCYATDMRPSASLVEFAQDADLFICEGMYGDLDKLEKAKEYHHCHFTEAAAMARDAGVWEMWLTHFSPSLPNPKDFLHLATAIYPNTHIDRKHTVLRFDQD